jgi:hypothetical protein
MIITIDTGQKSELERDKHSAFNSKLKSCFPTLVAFTYSNETGYLTLDLGADEDKALLDKIQNCLNLVNGVKVVKVIIGGLSS